MTSPGGAAAPIGSDPGLDLAHRVAALVARRSIDPAWWSIDANVERALRLATEHGVECIVADRLNRLAPRAATLRTARLGVVREALRQRELAIVLTRLTRAGIRPLLFKGAALACTHYPEPHWRSRVDADLLVRRRDIDQVAPILEERGYRRPARVVGDLVSPQMVFQRTDSRGVRHVLDVHWQVASPRVFADLLSYDEIEAEAVPVPALGAHARAAAATHALVLACTHRIAHHDDWLRLIWLYDIHLLVGGMSPADLDRFAELASARQMRTVCARSLMLASRWLGTELPPRLVDRLEVVEPDGAREATAEFVGGGSARLDVLRSDLRALPRWRDRLRLLSQHLFPSPEYIRARYGTTTHLWLPFLYGDRIVRGACRWLRRTG